MLSSARSFSKQVLNHRTQIQQQTKTQLRNQHTGPRAKDQQSGRYEDEPQQLVSDRMRQENRERKKRWRELNEERNKDNDLRCRVNKRANQLYGATSSAAKEKWIGEEFERRQHRRKEKELRKRQLISDSEEILVDEQSVFTPHDERASKIQRTETGSVLSQLLLPGGFGSYAGLPSHQVRAAYGLWKSVADGQALEAAGPVEHSQGFHQQSPVCFQDSSAMHSSSDTAVSSPGAASRVSLPPLSSVVPEELLHSPATLYEPCQMPPSCRLPPLLHDTQQCDSLPADFGCNSSIVAHHADQLCSRSGGNNALSCCHSSACSVETYSYHATTENPSNPRHAHVTLSAASSASGLSTNGCSSPSPYHQQPAPSLHRRKHVRPWEEFLSPAIADDSEPFTNTHPSQYVSSADMGGLSEAAFSLMSLSSSSSAIDNNQSVVT
ncbi:hypothetical protein COEREDRAFT_94339 [Coemansia reversa NRRL 1564]|uniref:DUF3020 domain-containing protein n=1 Tax=Coemansia reversa (strain ATCC 12441 / NRRL 1564) TaxID=763665 RepID=A0A2G5B4A7_COERN|nr:hypothetical protein COEREDRAFT_94339 [Coemansia reversa NRRL 1564]|eukprot:PIA13835.1 hypothetical protein COEREDRAFT_94339 [Coemansia reversa NRRL 1564]